MTDYVNPSNDFRPLSEEMGAVFRYAGHTPAFIAETSSTLVSDIDSVGVSDGPLGAFAKTGTSGLDFTVDTGEAMVEGALLARDTQETVTLPASASGTIYLAWDPSVENGLIIDHDSSGNVSGIPRTPLYDFTTDSSSVTGDTNRRDVGEHISVRNDRYETSDGSGISVDQADDASMLGGIGPSNYARTDQSESFSSTVSFGSDVSMNGNNIESGARIKSSTNNSLLELNGGENNEHLSLHTGETGSSAVQIWDRVNSNFLFRAFEGGQIEFPNGDVHILSGGLETDRGWAVRSDWGRRIETGSSFSSEAVDGDLLFEPQ